MNFIQFKKAGLSLLLPEKRSKYIFKRPDLFVSFTDIIYLFIHEDLIKQLDVKWKNSITLWDGELDFRESQRSDDDDLWCVDYYVVDFAVIPEKASLSNADIGKTPFAWDNKEIVINTEFVNALKQAGADFVWYDTFR